MTDSDKARQGDINRITWLLQPQDHRRKLQEDK